MFEKSAKNGLDDYRVYSRENQEQGDFTMQEILNSTIRNDRKIRVRILNPELEEKTSYTVAIVKVF